MCENDVHQNPSPTPNILLTVSKIPATCTSSESFEKCNKWLENCSLEDGESSASDCLIEDIDSNADSLSTTDCSSDYSQIITSCDKITTRNNNFLQNNQTRNVYENIVVKNSRKVHLGNLTVINGPVIINKAKNKSEHNKDDVSNHEHLKLAEAQIRWIDRRAWLSQPPVDEYAKLDAPAKYVIICHSATEDAETHAENVLLVRYIQQFHIESRNWVDIAYNFLIGCDGYTYKGRGWGVHGAHTFRYNSSSIGICFVGTFNKKLPPKSALDQARLLIKYGVEQGEIRQDYSLIGNCQVSSSQSPGKLLYEEIQTWENYDSTINLHTVPPWKGGGPEEE